MQCCQWRSVSHLEFFKKTCYVASIIDYAAIPKVSLPSVSQIRLSESPWSSLPSKTLILSKGSVLRCFSDSYVPNFCRTFPAANPHRACDYSQKSHYIWSFFPRYSFFSLIRINKSFKETFGQCEKSSIYSNADFFASY